jgi:hypothetical protein
MNINKLLIFHAIITLAAGLVLIVYPPLIPATVNIELHQNQFLLCYFLAAAELALAYLSFYGSKRTDFATLRMVTFTMIIFHSATLLLELFALANGLSPKIIANIVARIVIIGLFYYYGNLRISKSGV